MFVLYKFVPQCLVRLPAQLHYLLLKGSALLCLTKQSIRGPLVLWAVGRVLLLGNEDATRLSTWAGCGRHERTKGAERARFEAPNRGRLETGDWDLGLGTM